MPRMETMTKAKSDGEHESTGTHADCLTVMNSVLRKIRVRILYAQCHALPKPRSLPRWYILKYTNHVLRLLPARPQLKLLLISAEAFYFPRALQCLFFASQFQSRLCYSLPFGSAPSVLLSRLKTTNSHQTTH